ncbi:mitochondrial carrier domain-containing protein [Triangularia verruculosa]|uniref:Mitochondrial carrier domain-containing protein n=1 Tax=Triangularia verruculosa TaxID=2587418 RepID=A0AAN6XMK8_9PEZI|nr:mitochondrial carrier domain-containing protein [Triangularia verruculosa]
MTQPSSASSKKPPGTDSSFYNSPLIHNPDYTHLPTLPDGVTLQPPGKLPTTNAATGASAAGVRALTSQAIAFYFRAPVKAFFRTRVDYLAYARAIQEQQLATFLANNPAATTSSNAAWGWFKGRLRGSTPGLIASAVQYHGWRVVPDQVLPPLIANVGVGAMLYTTYLQILGRLHPESALASKRVYPPPSPVETFTAGFLAGAIQSLVAAPLDAVQARYDLGVGAAGMTGSGNTMGGATKEEAKGKMARPRSMWTFSREKLAEIGPRGIFAGWGLSLLKDSMGSAVFFSLFEWVKAQGYYGFVGWYYGSLEEDTIVLLSQKRPAGLDGKVFPKKDRLTGEVERQADGELRMPTVIRPHYAIEPAFLLLAGMGASVAQQVVLHPLGHIQSEHWERLEALDAKARKLKTTEAGNSRRMWKAYRDAYRVTWGECAAEATAAGLNMRQWLYRGFWWNTLRQVPSTSAGLIIFELVRRKYGFGGDQFRCLGLNIHHRHNVAIMAPAGPYNVSSKNPKIREALLKRLQHVDQQSATPFLEALENTISIEDSNGARKHKMRQLGRRRERNLTDMDIDVDNTAESVGAPSLARRARSIQGNRVIKTRKGADFKTFRVLRDDRRSPRLAHMETVMAKSAQVPGQPAAPQPAAPQAPVYSRRNL